MVIKPSTALRNKYFESLCKVSSYFYQVLRPKCRREVIIMDETKELLDIDNYNKRS